MKKNKSLFVCFFQKLTVWLFMTWRYLATVDKNCEMFIHDYYSNPSRNNEAMHLKED